MVGPGTRIAGRRVISGAYPAGPPSNGKRDRFVSDQQAPAEKQLLGPGTNAHDTAMLVATPLADQTDTGHSQTYLAGQHRGAVHADRGPAKPRTNPLSRFQSYPVGADTDRLVVELGHTSPAGAQ
jgi:hypothetical protein